jgi:F-type H+-transporting ATPase subunit b
MTRVRSLGATAVLPALLLLLTLLGGTPTPAAGAEGGHAGGASHATDLLWQALNLVILIAVLLLFARKPIQAFFSARRKQIATDLESAAALLAQAETRYSEWQHKLIDLNADMARIRAEGRARAEDDRAAIIADAQAAAERIHKNAVATVEQELRRAQSQLRVEAALLATELAEGILREKIEAADRDRLIDEFITRVEPGAAPGVRASEG